MWQAASSTSCRASRQPPLATQVAGHDIAAIKAPCQAIEARLLSAFNMTLCRSALNSFFRWGYSKGIKSKVMCSSSLSIVQAFFWGNVLLSEGNGNSLQSAESALLTQTWSQLRARPMSLSIHGAICIDCRASSACECRITLRML